jgi:hypothetical protein
MKQASIRRQLEYTTFVDSATVIAARTINIVDLSACIGGKELDSLRIVPNGTKLAQSSRQVVFRDIQSNCK